MSQTNPSHPEIIAGYEKNIQDQLAAIQKLKTQKKRIAIGRLFSVLAVIAIGWYFWPNSGILASVLIIGTPIFILLIFRDADKTNDINNREHLIRVNQHEIDAIRQNLNDYEDGMKYSEPMHAYASDLDLFGKSSLYQWISRCHSDQSREKLAKYLKTAQSVSTIEAKQKAASELSEKQAVCQQFQATAMACPLTFETEKKLNYWMSFPPVGFLEDYWKWLQNIYPLLPVFMTALYLMDFISANNFLLFLVALFIVQIGVFRKITSEFEMLLRTEQEMYSLQELVSLIENEHFESPFLLSLQTTLKPAGFSSAAASVRQLNLILKRIGWRSNLIINAILQLFFIWDLRLILSLNKWKHENRVYLQQWIQAVAEMEVMVSLASLVHNEPDWCFPEVDENYFHFQVSMLGHPLIPEQKRVTNDISIEGTGKVVLITGSNMAGKSTFLRSLGINIVLAQMGAPVCATRMTLSSVKLISSMRVADNLAENESTFFAELKKLQSIIECVEQREQVLILLDEVLRGTNSTDRHKGTRALVRQLLESGAVSVLATHDTELAYTEAADPSISNYHFEGKIEKDNLIFDYKIKKGICESLNATILMKKIGIHFEE